MRRRALLLVFLATTLAAWPTGAGLTRGPAVAEAQASSTGGAAAAGSGGVPTFQDLGSVPWAVPAIEGMAALGVMEGTAPDQFDPQGTTTRAQMAVVLDRLLAWGAAGAATTTARAVRFTDEAQIPAWAQQAVAAAAQRGILQGELGDVFDPNGPVTWAQVAVIAARAFGYPAVPAGDEQAYLAELPSGSVTPGWAADATARDVQAGDLTGMLASLFEPDQPVSRAALATFLMGAAAGAGNPDLMTGRVTAVQGQTVTVATGTGVQSLSSASSPAVYLGSTPLRLDQVAPGDSVSLVVQGGQVAWLQVTSVPAGAVAPTSVPPASGASGTAAPGVTSGVPLAALSFSPSPVAASGTLVGGASVNLTLTAQASGGQPLAGAAVYLSFTAAPGGGSASVGGTALTPTLEPFVTGTSGTLSLTYTAPPSPPASGTDSVTAANTASGATVTAVDSYAFAPGAATAVVPNSTVAGTVQSVNGTQSLTLAESGGTVVSIGLAPSPVVTFEGQTSSLSAVVAGDSVTVGVNGASQAATIAVTGTGGATGTVVPNSTVAGTVQSVNGAQSLTLAESGGAVVSMGLAPSPVVTFEGQTSSLSVVVAGDSVTIGVNGAGQAATIAVTGTGGATGSVVPNSTVTGTVEAVNGSQSLTLAESGGTVVTVPLASYVTVLLNGQSSTFGAIAVGDSATVTVNSTGQASYIDVATLGTAGSGLRPNSVVTGTVQAISPGQALTVEETGGGAVSVPLAAGVSVEYNGQPSSIGVVTAGQQVTVTVNALGQASSIDVVQGYGGAATVPAPGAVLSGTLEAVNGAQTLTMAVNGGTVEALPLATYVTVTLNGTLSNLVALAPGDQVTVTLNASEQVATVSASSAGYGTGSLGPGSTASGTVEGINGSQSITVAVNGTQVSTLVLYPYVTVTQNGTLSSIAAVAVGDEITFSLNSSDEVATIVITGYGNGTYGAGGSSVTGIVEAVEGTQSITVSENGSSPLALPLASSVSVTVNGSSTGLSDVAVGDTVQITLNVLGQAAQINVVSSSLGAPTGGTLVSGILAALDTSSQQVGVYSSGGLNTYTLASGATVTLAGQSTSLGSLALGDNISLALNSSSQASGVAASSPVPPEQAYTGNLVSSPTGSLLQLNTSSGTVSLNVGSEAVAVKNGSLTILSNLPPGTHVVVITEAAPNGSALVIAD